MTRIIFRLVILEMPATGVHRNYANFRQMNSIRLCLCGVWWAALHFIKGDMSKLDEFTINILTNPEVIEIDHVDPLGESGSRN